MGAVQVGVAVEEVQERAAVHTTAQVVGKAAGMGLRTRTREAEGVVHRTGTRGETADRTAHPVGTADRIAPRAAAVRIRLQAGEVEA